MAASEAVVWPEFTDSMAMTGSGSAGDPYLIQNIYDLFAMGFDRASHYKLMADLDCSGMADWDTAGPKGWIPIPYDSPYFPQRPTEDISTEAWTIHGALHAYSALADWHLVDNGDMETWYDLDGTDHDGDGSYVKEVDQYWAIMAVGSSDRHIPLNAAELWPRLWIVYKYSSLYSFRWRKAIRVDGTWYYGLWRSSAATTTDWLVANLGTALNPVTGSDWTRAELLGTAASGNLEYWGVQVEGGVGTTFYITKLMLVIEAQFDVDTSNEIRDEFTGTLDGNGKIIRNLPISNDSMDGGLFRTFGGEAYDLTLKSPQHTDDTQAAGGDGGAFAWKHHGYAHDITIEAPELWLGEGGAFAYEINDDGTVADGILCKNIKIKNPVLHATGGSGHVSGFANVLCSRAANVAKVLTSYVQNLLIDQAFMPWGITASDSLAGFISYVEDYADIEECWVTGKIDIDKLVFGFAHAVGPISGGTSAIIKNCYARVTLEEESTDSGDVTLAGFCKEVLADGTIEKCYAHVPSAVSPQSKKAGFCYEPNNAGTIDDCYYDNQTITVDLQDAATGRPTAAMIVEGTYSGWNFTSIWNISAVVNAGYPYLATAVPEPASGAGGGLFLGFGPDHRLFYDMQVPCLAMEEMFGGGIPLLRPTAPGLVTLDIMTIGRTPD